MKKLIVMTAMFISTVTLMAVTGCFDSSEHSMLFDEVMQGRTPGTISNPGGSGSNPAPSGSSQSSGDESQDSDGDGGGDDGGGSTPSYDKPAIFGDETLLGFTEWNEDGYITTETHIWDVDADDWVEATYRINDLGALGEFGQNEDYGYGGTVEASGYQFNIDINDAGVVMLQGSGGQLFATDQDGWRNGEWSVANGFTTQEELDAAKAIIEKVSE